MKQTKAIIGMILIVLSIAGLVFWETTGRDRMMREQVLVAEVDIEAGSEITADMLRVGSVDPQALLENGLRAEDGERVVGKVSRQYIPKNSQISKAFLTGDRVFLKGTQTIFPIRSEWIESVSSSVRRGDNVALYTVGKGEKIGEYTLAFVKDRSDREVQSPKGKEEPEVLGRIDADMAVSYVEVIAAKEDCKKLSELAAAGETFMILQEM